MSTGAEVQKIQILGSKCPPPKKLHSEDSKFFFQNMAPSTPPKSLPGLLSIFTKTYIIYNTNSFINTLFNFVFV